MKKALFILIIIAGFTSCMPKSGYLSCSQTREMNGKILKDAEGNLYRVDYRLGAVVALQPINKIELDSLAKK